jgi:uncharacterized membrane protein YphA (DoxX/SURF4 family)
MNSVKTSTALKFTYWITTIIIAIAFFITGIGNLIPFEHIAHDMAHLGYPSYFLKILGTWKIIAAVTIVLPRIRRIKEWAYAGMMLDLTGAALSRYFMNDGLPLIIVPLTIAGLVIISWSLRQKDASLG